MALNNDELQGLVLKLRTKYQDYAKRYSSKWFDLNAFEERLRMCIDNRMNLEGFILAEIQNFEKLKHKYDKKKNETSFSEHVDTIIEENLNRIKKYPGIKFHRFASLEVSHLYGAVNEFSLYVFPILWILVLNNSDKNVLLEYEDTLKYLAVSQGQRNPKRIEDHSLLLSRPMVREIEIERDKNEYLKECAFVLHKIIAVCELFMEERHAEWDVPVTFNKLYVEEQRKKTIADFFRGVSGYGAILKVRDYAQAIIDDFRLHAFKEK